MSSTQKYSLGWGGLAKQYDFSIRENGPYAHYDLPGSWENGWISEVNSADGLFAASAWFTTEQEINYTIHYDKPFLLVFCVDNGTHDTNPKRKACQTTDTLYTSSSQ